MTLQLEGMELRLVERLVESVERIEEIVRVAHAPKALGPEPHCLTCRGAPGSCICMCLVCGRAKAATLKLLEGERRFMDGYCEAASIDGGKVTRRCLRGEDHDGACDMRAVCPGMPGMASWKRCEKAKGHVPPCTHDPSANDGHVSPANDERELRGELARLKEELTLTVTSRDDALGTISIVRGVIREAREHQQNPSRGIHVIELFDRALEDVAEVVGKADGAPAKSARAVLDCFDSFLAGMRSPDWTPNERRAVRKAIEAVRGGLEGKCTCEGAPSGFHPPPCPKGDAMERQVEREVLTIGRAVVRGQRGLLELVSAFRRLVPYREQATGGCSRCGGQKATEHLEGCTANVCLVRPGSPEPDRLCQYPHGLTICGKKEPCEDHTPGVLREIAKDKAPPRNVIEAVHDLDAAVQAGRKPFHEVFFPRVAYDQSKPPVGTFMLTRSQLGDEPKCTCGAPLVVRHAMSCAIVQSKNAVPGADASHIYVTVCALSDLYRAAETCCPRTMYPTEVVRHGVTALLDTLHPSDAYKVVDGIRKERETVFAKLDVVTNRRRTCTACHLLEFYGADGKLVRQHGHATCPDGGHAFTEWTDTKSAGHAVAPGGVEVRTGWHPDDPVSVRPRCTCGGFASIPLEADDFSAHAPECPARRAAEKKP